jgi:hypothetical protein
VDVDEVSHTFETRVESAGCDAEEGAHHVRRFEEAVAVQRQDVSPLPSDRLTVFVSKGDGSLHDIRTDGGPAVANLVSIE